MSRREPERPVLDYSTGSTPDFSVKRGTVIIASIFVLFFVLFLYSGRASSMVLYRLLTDGLFLLAWLAAVIGVGAWLAKIFRIDSTAAFATSAALGIGLFSLITLGLGLAGLLNRVTSFALLAAGIGAGIALLLRNPDLTSASLSAKLAERIGWTAWLWLIAMPFLAIALLGALVPPGLLWGNEPNGYDVIEYHLQVPREWFEAGRIIPLHHNVFSYFPGNVEMHYLLAMHLRGGPWAGMYLAQLMHVTMIALTIIAIREFVGAKGIAGPLMAAATPWITLLAPIAYNEGGLLLFGTLAIGWMLRSLGISPSPGTPAEGRGGGPVELQSAKCKVQNSGARPRFALCTLHFALSPSALAGLFAGFACGVKLTAAPMLLAAIPIVCLIRRSHLAMLRPMAIFIAAGLLAFSPWLIRNLIWTHNPVFPEAMSLLGRAHFSPEQVMRWNLAYIPSADQLSHGGRIGNAWNQIFADWRYGYLLFPAALLAVFLAFTAVGGSPGPALKENKTSAVFLVSLLVIWFIFWIGFTHLQGRFFVLAIPVIALLVGSIQAPMPRIAVWSCAVAEAVISMYLLRAPIARRITTYEAAIGIESFSPLHRDDISRLIERGASICLAGDAGAFIYETPMSRLHYRTVFDVDIKGRAAIDAWLDGCPGTQGGMTIINCDELQRFARTYYGIPALPAGLDGTIIQEQHAHP